MEKVSGAILQEEVISFVKRMIPGVFVCHNDRTRKNVHLTRSGTVRGRSRTRQTLSDAWESMIAEIKKRWLKISRECWSRNLWKLSVENSTSCMRILKLKDTLEVVRDTRCLHCMGKRQNHVMMNSESESK